MENKPKVEILMATYNGSKYVAEQIDSILNQTYENYHLTISDDASTDNTVEIIDSYVSAYPSKITKVVSNIHFGNARDHFFWLMKKCNENYIMFSDQDDVWNKNKIEISMNELLKLEEKNTKDTSLLVFTDQTVVDSNLNIISKSMMTYQKQDTTSIDYKKLLFQNIVTGCTVCTNKALVELSLKFKDSNSIVMHDWWLAIVASRFGEVAYINQSTMLYRQHASNSVGAQDVKSARYKISVLKNIDILKDKIQKKKKQAELFEKVYSDDLSNKDKQFLNHFVKRRSGMKFYLEHKNLIYGLNRFFGFMILG